VQFPAQLAQHTTAPAGRVDPGPLDGTVRPNAPSRARSGSMPAPDALVVGRRDGPHALRSSAAAVRRRSAGIRCRQARVATSSNIISDVPPTT